LSRADKRRGDGEAIVAVTRRSERESPQRMDWSAITQLLAERSEQALVLLDRRGCIRLLNGAMERLLGWSRAEASLRRWTKLFMAGQPAQTTKRWLIEAFSAAPVRRSCSVAARDGRRWRLELDAALVGRGPAQALLMTVARALPLDAESGAPADHELDYQITSHGQGQGATFGQLQRIVQMGRTFDDVAIPARRCFEVLHQRQTPCLDCPVLRAGDATWPRSVVRRATQAAAGFQIVTAEPIGPTTVQVRIRFVAEGTLRAVHEVRLAQLADRAQLSLRERSVLEYLLMGRSLADIALILDLSRHTVKFHQGNILRKLGADSRADIARLTGY
jgi:PAS domain S-box-containing protein